jgi:ankyrin repeat protein
MAGLLVLRDARTFTSLATGHGQLDIVHLLLKSGSIVDDDDDPTPLRNAVKNGHLHIVTLLLDSGADVSIQNRNQKTPLDVARDNERLDAERLLKEWMRGVDSQDRINPTLLSDDVQQ